jgi:hypothetical protein
MLYFCLKKLDSFPLEEFKTALSTILIVPLKFLKKHSNVSLCEWNEGSWLWGVIVIRNFYLSLLNLC